MLSNVPAERLLQALTRSLRYASPEVRAVPQLGEPGVLWTLAQVLGVWAGLPVVGVDWLRADIEDFLAPVRSDARAGLLLRAAEAATRAPTYAALDSAARSLGVGLSAVGADVLALLLGSDEFRILHARVERYAPRPSGGNAMAADDFDDEDLPMEGETRDVELPQTAHTTFDPQGPWVNPDGLPTEGVDWTKVATAGVDAAKDFLTGVTRSNYQPPPGTTPQTPPAEPPRPPAPPPGPPPPSTPPAPPAQARSSGGSGLLWGLFGLAVLAGGAVAVRSGGRRSRRGDVL